MEKESVNINIEISDSLHKKIKLEAAKKGITLKELIIETLKKKAELKK